jgi:hypothetical protein
MKKCPQCSILKPKDEWNKNSSSADGLQRVCRACSKEIYLRNRDKNLKQKKEYYLKNAEALRIEGREKYLRRRDRVLIVRKQYCLKNKSKIQKKTTERYRTDVSFRLRVRLRVRLGHFLKNRSKTGVIEKYLGLNRHDYVKYIESKWLPDMNWDNYGHGHGKWCIDHIVPLCHFDFEKEDHVALASHYSNTQPLWFSDNSRLGSKDGDLPKDGFLEWAKNILSKNKFDF